MPRCLMAKKWKAAPAAELDETDEEIDVVGDGRGRSPAPAATAPGPPPRDPEPTLLYNAADNADVKKTYAKLKESGKNSVDGIVQWLEDAKIIEKTKESQDKVRSYFADVSNKADVNIQQFSAAVEKIAGEQKKTLADMAKCMMSNLGTLANAVQAGASAFKQAMEKKKKE